MGKLKQLHIDCYKGECLAASPETCYAQYEKPFDNLSMEGTTVSLEDKKENKT